MVGIPTVAIGEVFSVVCFRRLTLGRHTAVHYRRWANRLKDSNVIYLTNQLEI